MAVKNVTELDYDQIRSNLKTFMASQSEFADYDFDASGLSVILDLLAYNTHYNAILAHMTANEAFLDSAIKRSSIASIAKTMGYTARSARSARATVTLEIEPDSSYSLPTLTLTKDKTFTTSLNGKTYTFYPAKDYTVNKTVNGGGRECFLFQNIEIIEGKLLRTSQIIETGFEQGPVLLNNPNVDTTTILVTVQESATNTDTNKYTLSNSINNVTSTTKAFFVEESVGGLYEIRFGDGVIGNKLEAGNIAIVDYISTNHEAGNGAKSFTAPSLVTGSGETKTLTVVTKSAGGARQESVDSIRFNAPRFNASKNRAVTGNDYSSLILQANPNVKSVTVWGGEINDPPIYGKVFVSLQPKDGLVITQDDKDVLLRDTISPKQPISLTTEFIDPEYTYIGMKVKAQYDKKLSKLTPGEISSLISTEITNYFNEELNILDANFYYSKLTTRIVGLSRALLSANLELRLQKRTSPVLNASAKYILDFNNKINGYSINSNYFNVKINGATSKVFISDIPNTGVVSPDWNGTGTLVLKTATQKVIINSNVGTVDYTTGKVTLNDLFITEITGQLTDLRVTSIPHESSKDIKTETLTRKSEISTGPVTALPAKNTILVKDDSVLDAPNNVLAGIDITAYDLTLDS